MTYLPYIILIAVVLVVAISLRALCVWLDSWGKES